MTSISLTILGCASNFIISISLCVLSTCCNVAIFLWLKNFIATYSIYISTPKKEENNNNNEKYSYLFFREYIGAQLHLPKGAVAQCPADFIRPHMEDSLLLSTRTICHSRAKATGSYSVRETEVFNNKPIKRD